MSYNSDPRVLFAAERTLLAWQRTALALMSLGFVVERFGLSLQMARDQSASVSQRSFSLGLGVLLLLGATVALISARQYRQVTRALDVEATPRVLDPGGRCAQRRHRPDRLGARRAFPGRRSEHRVRQRIPHNYGARPLQELTRP